MKRSLALILTAILVITSFTACSFLEGLFGSDLRINVPQETIQAELGSYDLPKFDVVDADNLIKAGYEVIVKQVVDPNGNEVKVAYNKINATVPGIYTITYGVADGKVKDAELKVDFADRTAPTLDMDEDALPKYYIQGMKYSLPVYSLSGEPDYDACYVKVYYVATPDGEKTEVALSDGYFTVEHNTGVYQILIHAEDAAGNVKEYTFNIEATGPSEKVEGKIIYADEQFGVSQLSFLWNVWTMSYSTERAWDKEAGSIKVVASSDSTDYLILSKLIQRDVSDYDELVLRIYNANDYEIYTGCAWFGDTVLEANAWTEVVFSLDDLNEKGSHPAVSGLKPSSEDLENLSLRFWTDYEKNTLKAGSEVYISAMYARKNEITGPSEVKDDVIGYYDEIWGSMQGGFYWTDCNKQEFVTDVKHGEEKGSLKITCLKDNQGWNYYILKQPAIKDVTKYDFIEFYVYNPNEKDFLIQLLWGGDTTCKAGEWTHIQFPVSLITGGVTDVSGATIPATDITNLTMCIWTTDMLKGSCFYFSEMRGGYYPEELPENLVTNFDGATGLNPFNGTSSVEYVTDVKYGEEKGSLKITANGTGEHYVSILDPRITDVSGYDYLVFRVYTDKEITAGLLWCADTVCKAGEWTEVKIPVSYFGEGKVTDFAAALSATDIKGISLRVFSGLNAGECVYVSSVFAMKEETPPAPAHTCESVCSECGKCLNSECTDAACSDKCEGHGSPEVPQKTEDVISKLDDTSKLNPFQSCAKLEYVTDVKYGSETGSLKIVANKSAELYIAITSTEIKDISSYEYVALRVYNPNSYEVTVGTMWCCDTLCKAGEWTEIKVALSYFEGGSVDALSGADVLPTDVTGFAVRIVGTMTVGDSLYVSSVVAVKEQNGGTTAPETENILVSKLDSDAGLNPFNGCASVEYATDIKYDAEDGSLKITAKATAEMYIAVTAPTNKNAKDAKYVVFRVYNPTDHEITVGTMWCCDTVCKAGEWTEIKVDRSEFESGKVDALSGADVTLTDLTGFSVRIVGTMAVGECIYVSHVYAVK